MSSIKSLGFLLGAVMMGLVACSHSVPRETTTASLIKTSGLTNRKSRSSKVIIPANNKLRLSLKQAVQTALAHNRDVLIARETIQEYQEAFKAARSAYYPSLAANLTYTRLDEVTIFETGTSKVKIGDEDNYKGELNLTQSLYTGGRIRAEVESARLDQQIALQAFKATRQQIIFITCRAYYAIVLARELVEVRQQSLAMARAHLDEVTRKHRQGVASNYDLLRARVELTNISTDAIKAANALRLSRIVLLNILGRSVNQDTDALALTDGLDYTPWPEASPDKLKQVALTNRPDLSRLALTISQQKEAFKVARAESLPEVSLFGNWGSEKPSSKDFGDNIWSDYWNTGLTLGYPLFEGGRLRSRVNQEKIRLRQKELAYQRQVELVKLELTQAMLNLQDARELMAAQKENTSQAEEGLRLVEISYREGIATQLAVMDTQTALAQARQNLLEARHAYSLAKLQLTKVMGILDTTSFEAEEIKQDSHDD